LLAEPEEELATVRGRILAAAGPNAGLLTAGSAEFAALLAVPPDPGDPLTAQVRAQRASTEVFRAVASRERPVVMFLDDLQWAGRVPLGFVDLLLTEEPVKGLLLVGVYREGDVAAAHPLAAPLSRWRDQAGVRHLHLDNLPAPSLAAMVAEMLHARRAATAGLVQVIEPRTSGNPHETVELLSALRRDGVMTATADGWRWDEAAVRAYLGQSDVTRLWAARVEAMPPTSRQMVKAMACLGGRAELSLLQAATGVPASAVDQALASALGEGLLVAEPGAHPAVRFRHDRIREAVLGALDPRRRRALQLAMARRLALVPELFAVAAEQYLPVADAIGDAAERRQVAGLLRRAAGQAGLIGDYALVNALLTTALRLIDPGETATVAGVHAGRHAALYSLGRLEEADEEYHTIEELGAVTAERADVIAVQVRSLTHRKRFAEAIGLCIESLRELGVTVPTADRLRAELDRQFDILYRWLDHTDGADDLARPEITDPALLAAARLINAVLPAAFSVADGATLAWLSLEALRIWLQHGLSATLLGPAGTAGHVAMTMRGDYPAGYRALRRIIAVGEARGYEPGTSQARFLFGSVCWWFEPIENGVQAIRQALREAVQQQRPWHWALIAERAARFNLAHGLEHAGYDLLTQARRAYLAWGATAKVGQLDWAYPALRPSAGVTAGDGPDQSADLPQRRGVITTGTIDLLGIVSASQALSSETSIGRLQTRVVQVLSAMTGATGVHLLLWSDDRRHWLLPAPEGDGGTVPADGTGDEGAVPMSVLRYVQRTREPLVVDDAVRDDRFARDLYFADADCCSLLAVPIVSRALLRAVLLLENRLIRGAFTAERLDAVQLIAGQLAVSLDNAQLYAELTASRARIVAAADQARRQIERDLHDGAQQRLVSLALHLRAAQAAAPPTLAAELDRAVAEATGALDELRKTARGIHPAILAEGGLRPALRTLARRSPVPVALDLRADGRLPDQIEVSAAGV
jgi:GAF domain-containing protein